MLSILHGDKASSPGQYRQQLDRRRLQYLEQSVFDLRRVTISLAYQVP